MADLLIMPINSNNNESTTVQTYSACFVCIIMARLTNNYIFFLISGRAFLVTDKHFENVPTTHRWCASIIIIWKLIYIDFNILVSLFEYRKVADTTKFWYVLEYNNNNNSSKHIWMKNGCKSYNHRRLWWETPVSSLCGCGWVVCGWNLGKRGVRVFANNST